MTATGGGAVARFIPVGTGNTPGYFVDCCQQQVHPRGHGEHRLPIINTLFNPGSSPWARGTHIDTDISHPVPRFIPVGTGNTVG